MNILELSQRQKKRFENQARELLKNENAKDAIVWWDGTILWDLNNKPHLAGFKKEKLRDAVAADYNTLMEQLVVTYNTSHIT
jgi:hypothetical protein